MIRILQNPKLIIAADQCPREWEYSCPACFKPIKWNTVNALSPFNCPGCRQTLADLSKIISDARLRMEYHTDGNVKCGQYGGVWGM